jgi:cullin-4
MQSAFCNSEALRAAMKDAFEGFLNYRQDRTAELLALHIHQCLQRPLAPNRLESFAGNMLLLFRHLHSKDVFEASYKRFLAERLLRGLSADLSLEKTLISGMREECGGVYTSRMETIVKDVDQSVEFTEHFKVALGEMTAAAAEKDKKVSMGLLAVTSVTIVSGLWPLQGSAVSAVGVQAPSQVGKIEAAFSEFYMQKRRNCSLKWNELLGSVLLRARFREGKGAKELATSVPQAMVLLQFIDRKVMERSVEELGKLVSMPRDVLEGTLGSLSSAKWPVLLRDPQSPNTYRINEDFDCEERRVPLFAFQSPFLSAEEALNASGSSGATPVMSTASLSSVVSSEATGAVSVSVILERQGQVDSLLVRRMKLVGQAERSELVNYALATLKTLSISAADVAGRVEHLIGHGYFEASGPAKQSLTYIP